MLHCQFSSIHILYCYKDLYCIGLVYFTSVHIGLSCLQWVEYHCNLKRRLIVKGRLQYFIHKIQYESNIDALYETPNVLRCSGTLGSGEREDKLD